ncbi:hypothetical protein HBH98_219450 [Parastagonospora nodorum]|nr:hypothetical protein HBH53_213670 [Parastagonospora nodorum]KAH3958289.1 hypothetical protein HBH51_212730 [Parastagonospora nodorum]KAH4015993.1 hypothetical protein HBI09_204510 [Parastagonospora nodorum]KAH4337660.1 hypothetical protein HBH98_219450 [Parastagonospora nodorum]KAH4360305.1 hypothetical protein HBH97_208000 [Parastagonospora nodorum]
MPINWQEKAVQDRLLTAVIASIDKINVAEIARLYGGDMTYNAAENYLRKFRKAAKEMNGHVAPTAAPSTVKPRAKKSGANPVKTGVQSGRVTKKAAPKAKVKAEVFEDDVDGPKLGDNGSDFEQDMDEEEEV